MHNSNTAQQIEPYKPPNLHETNRTHLSYKILIILSSTVWIMRLFSFIRLSSKPVGPFTEVCKHSYWIIKNGHNWSYSKHFLNFTSPWQKKCKFASQLCMVFLLSIMLQVGISTKNILIKFNNWIEVPSII